MKLILFDDSRHASERLHLLSDYAPEHGRTVHELVGMNPDLVLLDESVTTETAKEMLEWGWSVCLVAQRVTVALRRKFPMVRDMVTDANLRDYLAERFVPVEGEPENDSVAEPTKETTHPTGVQKKDVPSASVVVQPHMSARPISGRSAKVLGFEPLRSHGGGAGKTGVVFNYAAYAVKHGRKVLVIDLDPNGPFGVLAQAKQDLTTEHWCNLMAQHQGGHMTERAVFDNVERQHPYGFDMITSPSKEDMIEPKQFRWILEQTSPYFDLILFDVPAAWTMTTIEMMRLADEIFLFGQYDPIQYVEYKRSIQKVTNPLVGGVTKDHLHIVMGRAYVGKNRDVELEEVKRQLGVSNAVLIPEDPLFQQYRNEHKAIVLEKPTADCAKALIPWLKEHLEAERFSPNLPVLYEPKPRSGFFARLFRGDGSKKSKTNRSKAVGR